MIDTHAHLDGWNPSSEREWLERAEAEGVQAVIAVGGRPEANRNALEWARASDGVFAAVGFDRDTAVEPVVDADWPAQAADARTVAIGETGLDYHYTPETAEAQKARFMEMLEWSARVGKPAIIHSREADEDTLKVLDTHIREHGPEAERIGVLHCFTGSRALAFDLLDRGLYISFSGIVTFRNADALRAVARDVPDDRLLIETDCPYLTPAPHRGKPNEPAYVRYVAEQLAEVRDCSVGDVDRITTANARRLFELPVSPS